MNNNKDNSKKSRIFYLIFAVVIIIGYFVKERENSDEGAQQSTSKVFSKTADADEGNVEDAIESGNAENSNEKESEILARRDLSSDIETHSEGLSQIMGEQLVQPAPYGNNEVIFFKNSFIVSYNMKTKCPNYVAWQLTKERVKGQVTRTDEFIGDDVIAEASRVESYDYNGSGYDRGHMCPAADNRHDEMSMLQSFMMTNICPQDHDFNAGDWNDLEMQCRRWVKAYSDLFIVCGPIFDSKTPKTIGKRKNVKIAVPDRFFKVILMLGRQPKTIGFIYPNANTNKDMRDYCVSVDRVEAITGIDFYPSLPDDIEKKIEKECNPSAWGI